METEETFGTCYLCGIQENVVYQNVQSETVINFLQLENRQTLPCCCSCRSAVNKVSKLQNQLRSAGNELNAIVTEVETVFRSRNRRNGDGVNNPIVTNQEISDIQDSSLEVETVDLTTITEIASNLDVREANLVIEHRNQFANSATNKRQKLRYPSESSDKLFESSNNIWTSVVLDTLFSFMDYQDLKSSRLVCRSFNEAFLHQAGQRIVIHRKTLCIGKANFINVDPRLFRNITFLPRSGVLSRPPYNKVSLRNPETDDLDIIRRNFHAFQVRHKLATMLSKVPDLGIVRRLDMAINGIHQVREFATVINDGLLPNLETLSVFILGVNDSCRLDETPFRSNAFPKVKTLILRNIGERMARVISQHVLDAACNVETLFCRGTHLNLENCKALRNLKLEVPSWYYFDASQRDRMLKLLQTVKTSLYCLRFKDTTIPSKFLPVFPNVNELSFEKCQFQGKGNLASCFPNLKSLHVKSCYDFKRSYASEIAVSRLLQQLFKRGAEGLKFLEMDSSCISEDRLRRICTQRSAEMPLTLTLHTRIGNSLATLESIVNINASHLIVCNELPKFSLPKLWKKLLQLKLDKVRKGTIEIKKFDCVCNLTEQSKGCFLPAIQNLAKSWKLVKFSNCKLHEDVSTFIRETIDADNLPSFATSVLILVLCKMK